MCTSFSDSWEGKDEMFTSFSDSWEGKAMVPINS
jgi:hypothetical protein